MNQARTRASDSTQTNQQELAAQADLACVQAPVRDQTWCLPVPSWFNLGRRRLQPEIMDRPGLDQKQHSLALQGLARINRISRSAETFWPRIRSLARSCPDRRVRVLDVATGGGDVAIQLWQRARESGLGLHIDGCDRSSFAIAYARDRATKMRVPVQFFVCNALDDPLPDGYDVTTSSLFLHHLGNEQAVRFLQAMAQAARQLVLINDLIRSHLGYAVAYFGTRLLSSSPIVHVDGPRSVECAFTIPEARSLAERAGLQGARVTWCWPFRYLLSWRRP